MALTSVDAQRASDSDLVSAIQELQRLKFTVTAGTTAAADINVAGIVTTDNLVAVLQFDVDTGAVVNLADRTSEASITSSGHIQLTTTNTSGDVVLVVWFDKAA